MSHERIEPTKAGSGESRNVTPRIYATETERAIGQLAKGVQGMRVFNDGQTLVNSRYIHPDIKRTDGSGMLSNGGRYYVDWNGQIEDAKPEDTRIDEGAVLNEVAGDLFMIDSLLRYLRTNHRLEKLYLNKRVIDDNGNTWGVHRNISADGLAIKSFNDEYLHLLGLTIASGQVFIGAGMVRKYPQGSNSYFSLSQKITDLEVDYSSATTAKKPLINTRDEPHSGGVENLLRIHLTSTDEHVSTWAAGLTYGMASLALRAIEQDYKDALRLDDSGYEANKALVGLAHHNAYDDSLTRVSDDTIAALMARRARFGTSNYTTLEVQKRIVEIVEKTEHSSEEATQLEKWKTAIVDLERDPTSLEDRSDALAKLGLLRKIAAKHDKDDWSFELLAKSDKAYGQVVMTRDDVESDALTVYKRSVLYRLRTERLKGMHPSDQELLDRMVNPPTTTRAAVRGHYIKKGAKSEWGMVHVGGRNIMLDPFMTGTSLPAAS